MHVEAFPAWTMLPFGVLLVAIATLPTAAAKTWEKASFQLLVVVACAAPVLLWLASAGLGHRLVHVGGEYLSFVLTLGALYVTAGGIRVTGDLRATPATNVAFLLVGSALASVIGTTGASMLLIRPLLATNRERDNTGHLVPLFIMAVANAGGLLTPIGDPPLLLGYLAGVPFFWTLRLLPFWVLYVGVVLAATWIIDSRAYARESPAALERDRVQIEPLRVEGWLNAALLLATATAVMLPSPRREIVLVAITVLSLATTPRARHESVGFSLRPILEVALIFAGIFACLVPVEAELARRAPSLPLQHGWQLFWGAGALSAVLDNAPTYAAFSALASGLSHGAPDLVAGVAPAKLMAVSVGSVTMGAMTYVGNGPNLLVKAVAERSGFPVPSFARYALFAAMTLVPAHIVASLAIAWLER
jgi:Na+/H+ antiporter NhaD/arsenite permease-like protein